MRAHLRQTNEEPPELTAEERRILDAETRKLIAANSKKFAADYEAMLLWSLHVYCGFGKKRLLRFREQFIKEAKELRRFYELDNVGFAAKVLLKDIGIDVDELIKKDMEEDS